MHGCASLSSYGLSVYEPKLKSSRRFPILHAMPCHSISRKYSASAWQEVIRGQIDRRWMDGCLLGSSVGFRRCGSCEQKRKARRMGYEAAWPAGGRWIGRRTLWPSPRAVRRRAAKSSKHVQISCVCMHLASSLGKAVQREKGKAFACLLARRYLCWLPSLVFWRCYPQRDLNY